MSTYTRATAFKQDPAQPERCAPVRSRARRGLNHLGSRYGRFLIVERRYVVRPNGIGVTLWFGVCSCGQFRQVDPCRLASGEIVSCGCYRATRPARVKHGQSKTGEYRSYLKALGRCLSDDPNYGGRGIEFRFKSFDEFLAHIGRKPTPSHSLDRIDVNGHYEVGNVRWATHSTQSNNRRDTQYLTVEGKSLPLMDWARISAMRPNTLSARRRLGWCDECTVNLRPYSVEAKRGCIHKRRHQ